jgi:hypothetical protein
LLSNYLLRCAKHGAPNALREFDRYEVVVWIKVIFARFVNDADQTEFGRFRVGNQLVEFAQLQRRGVVVVLNANHEAVFVRFHVGPETT